MKRLALISLAGLAALLLSAYFFVLRPVVNSIIRVQEYEADMFGLNAARRPRGHRISTESTRVSEPRRCVRVIYEHVLPPLPEFEA